MTVDAYCVLIINDRTNAIVSAGIYSEPRPTLAGGLRSEVLLHRQAPEYAQARDEIRAILRQALKHGETTRPLRLVPR